MDSDDDDWKPNLTRVEPSRRPPKRGDVFAVRYEGLGYVFGRVIEPKVESASGVTNGSTLIYLYAGLRSTTELPDRDHFSVSNLLCGPMLVNRSPWSRGGVETIGNVAIADDERLNPNCFLGQSGRNHDVFTYHDESGNRLDGPVPPVGAMGLQNVRSIDLRVSRALGMADPPDPVAADQGVVRRVEAVADGFVSVAVDAERPELLALAERINARFEEGDMSGYNWGALIEYHLNQTDPSLLEGVQLHSEAAMFSARMAHSPDNVMKMRQIEAYIRELLADEDELLAYIEHHHADINWDMRSVDLRVSRALGEADPPDPVAAEQGVVRWIESAADGFVSVAVDAERPDLLALGDRINARFEAAYMNGYNWEALIAYHLSQIDPGLLKGVQLDSEAGTFTAHMPHSPDNVMKMRQIEAHIRELLADEDELLAYIEHNHAEIPWD